MLFGVLVMLRGVISELPFLTTAPLFRVIKITLTIFQTFLTGLFKYNVRFLGVFLDLPTLKLDVINGRSLMGLALVHFQKYWLLRLK